MQLLALKIQGRKFEYQQKDPAVRELCANLGPGLFFLILGWLLPKFFPHLPTWAKVTLFVVGVVALLFAVFAMLFKKPDRPAPKDENSSINVVMKNNNQIGHIGHRKD